MSGFTVRRDGESRAVVVGPLTFSTVNARTLEASRKSLASDGSITEVDLSSVPEGDSAGLALLIEWAGWFRGNGGQVRFSNPPPSLLGIAALCDVSALLAWDEDPGARTEADDEAAGGQRAAAHP